MRNAAKMLVLTLLAVALVLTGCGNRGGSSSGGSGDLPDNVPDQIREKWPIKIMVIRKIGGDDHTAQYLAGAKEEGEKMGFTVDTYSANGDSAKFHDAIQQAMNQDYDGIIISHGDDEATIDEVRQIVDKGIPVVTFDSIEGIKDIPGVTMTAQDDFALAQLALDQLVKRHRRQRQDRVPVGGRLPADGPTEPNLSTSAAAKPRHPGNRPLRRGRRGYAGANAKRRGRHADQVSDRTD